MNYLEKVRAQREKNNKIIEKAEKEKSAREYMREYLLQTTGDSGKSKLQELLDAQHDIATKAEDLDTRQKSITASLALFAGKEEATSKASTNNNVPIMITINPVRADNASEIVVESTESKVDEE